MRNILEIVSLIRFLESDATKDDKAAQIKAARDNGEITPAEALDLALEYFT